MLTKKQLKRKRVNLMTKQNEPVEVFDKQFSKLLKDIRRGDFCSVSIEVEREGVVFTYEKPSGTGTVVLKNLLNK